jgi:hypothetical protein
MGCISAQGMDLDRQEARRPGERPAAHRPYGYDHSFGVTYGLAPDRDLGPVTPVSSELA